jgi:hypothetical protein
VISQVIKKPKLLFEERLIVESALNLWVGCLLHRSELFQEFTEPREPGFSAEEFLLTGLLYCSYETVREDFRQTLSALCATARGPAQVEQANPLASVLQLLSSNFSLISAYPSKQYFELFCELMDRFVLLTNTGALSEAEGKVIDSEALLSAVISRIREENSKA